MRLHKAIPQKHRLKPLKNTDLLAIIRTAPTAQASSRRDAEFAPSLVILTDSDGLYNLPDNVLLLLTATSIKDENWFIEELGKFILSLKELGMTHRIQHFAIAFSKDKPDYPATVQTADVTCLRLY